MRPDLCTGHVSTVEGPMRPGACSIDNLSAVVPTPLRRESGNVFSSGRSACDHPARPLAPSAFCLLSAFRRTQQQHALSVHPFHQKELT